MKAHVDIPWLIFGLFYLLLMGVAIYYLGPNFGIIPICIVFFIIGLPLAWFFGKAVGKK